MTRVKPHKFDARDGYFAVNNRTLGLRTSFRVSGRLGELALRFCMHDDAKRDAKRLNRAYEMGYQAGYEFALANAAPSLSPRSGETT